jgi:hypothetical protein
MRERPWRTPAHRASPRPAAARPGTQPASVDSAAALRWATAAAWLVIALFASVLIAIARGPHRIGAFDVETDFYGGYAPAAVALQHGHLLTADGRLPAVFGFVGPLYPALLALVAFASGDLFDAAEALSVVACVSVVVLWFLLLRRRANGGLALVAVLLLVTNPLLVRYGYSATTDATALALQSATLFALFMRGGVRTAVLAGCFAGLATLTRYNSAYLVPAGLLAIGLGATPHDRRRVEAVGFLLGWFALALPWQLYRQAHGGELMFHQLVAFDVYGKARGLDWDTFLARVWPRFEHSPGSVWSADPGAVAGRMLFNLGDHFRLDARLLLGLPVACAAALAPALALTDRRLLRLTPLGLAGLCAYLSLVPAAHDERYSLAVLPYYALMAAATLTAAVVSRWKPWAVTVVRSALVLGVVGLSLRGAIAEQAHVLEQQPLEILSCAGRLKQLAERDDRVIARKPHLAFHAGVGAVYFPPFDSLEALAQYARTSRARWLFVSPAEVQLRPAAAFLLDTSATVPGLTLRAYASVPTRVDGLDWQRVAALYEIEPAFGRSPPWFADETQRSLHLLRGMAATLPDARVLLRLANVEVRLLDLPAAQAAWRAAARIDPPGFAGFVRRFDGDTLTAVAQGLALMR